ncbi:hypothetical protein WMY93_031365 [Mugilogobius chulae]|uniref:HAT C-terminal dimerisation domain-containing protein n=1 Tax=Mugilogobius chulae TaxID=88201 RepID=A0AAW0MEA9_9GOBI
MTRHHPEKPLLSTEPKGSVTQPTIGETFKTKYPAASPRAKKITSLLLAHICKDLRPYNVVENEVFRELLEECEPRYTIPTRHYITEIAMPRLYAEVKNNVVEYIAYANRVAITCDAWTSRATQSYITVTYFLVCVMDEWGLKDKDPVLVTDNAGNMAIAAEIAKLLHIRCFAHTINLSAERALKTPTVSRLLGRIRQIVTFFRKSTTASHVLQQKQKLLNMPGHKLMSDVQTRWNSAFDMLERFLEQQPAVCAALLSPEVRKNAKELWTLTEADIACAEDAAAALRPLKVATLVMSEEKTPTVSVVAPLISQLSQGAVVKTSDSAVTRDIKHAIAEDLGKRYPDKTFLRMASALDPRFKALPFLSEEEQDNTFTIVATEAARMSEKNEDITPIQEPADPEVGEPPCKRKDCALSDLFGETFSLPKRQDCQKMSPYNQAMNEVRGYREAEPIELSGTSVAAERVFSTAGDIVTAQRSVLKPEHVDQLLFLNKNLPKRYKL